MSADLYDLLSNKKCGANLSKALVDLRPMMWWKEPYPGLGPII